MHRFYCIIDASCRPANVLRHLCHVWDPISHIAEISRSRQISLLLNFATSSFSLVSNIVTDDFFSSFPSIIVNIVADGGDLFHTQLPTDYTSLDPTGSSLNSQIGKIHICFNKYERSNRRHYYSLTRC